MKPRPFDELLAAAREAERLDQEAQAARKRVGQQVVGIRASAMMTQTSFAARLGKSQSYLSQVESGTRTPSIPTVNAIAALAHDALEAQIPDVKEPHAKEEDSSNE